MPARKLMCEPLSGRCTYNSKVRTGPFELKHAHQFDNTRMMPVNWKPVRQPREIETVRMVFDARQGGLVEQNIRSTKQVWCDSRDLDKQDLEKIEAATKRGAERSARVQRRNSPARVLASENE